MASTALRTASLASPAMGHAPSPVPIILDCGDCAKVVSVMFARPPQVGDRFEFEGSGWEIVRDRDLLRGYVARAVRSGACVH